MQKINIVVYGDSNIYGYSPDGYRYNLRYGIVLNRLLGDFYQVFEEGVVGRTTIYNDEREGKKAVDTISNDLGKYNKIDLLAVMLGTNDYKTKNARDLSDLKYGIKTLIEKIKELNNVKRILLISPILLDKNIDLIDKEFDYNSYVLSLVASQVYEELAKENDLLFFDAKYVAHPGMDGEHFTKEGHINLGNTLANFIRKNLNVVIE